MASFHVLRLSHALRQFLLVTVAALGAIASTAAVAAPSGRVTIAWHVTISPSWFDPSTAPPHRAARSLRDHALLEDNIKGGNHDSYCAA